MTADHADLIARLRSRADNESHQSSADLLAEAADALAARPVASGENAGLIDQATRQAMSLNYIADNADGLSESQTRSLAFAAGYITKLCAALTSERERAEVCIVEARSEAWARAIHASIGQAKAGRNPIEITAAIRSLLTVPARSNPP